MVARSAGRPGVRGLRAPHRRPSRRGRPSAGPADYKGPHILFYGHYDVQPVDPLSLWHSDPFDPQFVDGPRGKRFVARGAVDDKGQTMMFLEALRAWHEAGGGIPARITVLIEGEEEVGSVNLDPFLRANKADLAADLALISDTGMWDVETPAVTTRLRGMTYAEVTLEGRQPRPALRPVWRVGAEPDQCADQDPRRSAGRERPHPVARLLRQRRAGHQLPARAMGCAGLRRDGVPGRHRPDAPRWASAATPALERLWARPTADINGIWGGYTGAGSKTVIASEASAKVSFRLVPNQDPDEVMEQFKRFVTERCRRARPRASRISPARPASR